MHDLQTHRKYFDILAALFITTLIVSNIVSVKLIGAGPLVFDAGTILFPLAYILGDVITEIYGFRKMRRLLIIGIGMLLLTSLVFFIVSVLPSATGWTGQDAYLATLGVVWRIIFASVTAIFVGELLNSYVLVRLKNRYEGKYLWGRIIGSSVISDLVDTVVFSLIAFAGTISGSTLLALIVTVYGIKLAVETIVSPLTVILINYIKRTSGEDDLLQNTTTPKANLS